MKIKIKKITKLSNQILEGFGLSAEDAAAATENFLEGELTGKKSHGFVRIPWMKKKIDAGKINPTGKMKVVKETPVSILVDGDRSSGYSVVNYLLDLAIEKAQKSGMVIAGTSNTAPSSGLVGFYARKATEQDLIFIAFSNSNRHLVPFGAKEDLVGTNPITIGMPTGDLPIILDMASSKKTYGDLLVANSLGLGLDENIALDAEGNPTTDAAKALEGGLLPIAGHKGSGLGIIVELMAGALTNSKVGTYKQEMGWGTSFILIDPNIMRDLDEYKKDMDKFIQDLKALPRADGVDEIYFPGERSQKKRLANLEKGEIEIEDSLYQSLKELVP